MTGMETGTAVRRQKFDLVAYTLYEMIASILRVKISWDDLWWHLIAVNSSLERSSRINGWTLGSVTQPKSVFKSDKNGHIP